MYHFRLQTYILLLLACLLVNTRCYSQDDPPVGYYVLSNSHCSVSIVPDAVRGNTLPLIYETLPANQSGQNHNSLWLWRSTEVPWKYPPMKKQLLPSNATQSGSYVLEDISINIDAAYIACYSVDSNDEQICACSHLAANSDSTYSEWVNIELLSVTTNALSFRYATMAGYLPATYKNWFGVWEGKASPYNSFAPLGTGKPQNDASTNTAAINNIRLSSGQTYTLIYFTGEKLIHAAAMLTFVVK